jgi:DNA-binding GntR family transcriptional regulator
VQVQVALEVFQMQHHAPHGALRIALADGVEQVVAHGTRADILALRRLVRDEEATYRRGERAEGLRLSLAFHARLGAMCGNPVLVRYLNELVLQTSLAVALYEQPGRAHAHADHVDLVEAIVARDAKRATRLMADHLGDLERDLELGRAPRAPSLASIFGAADR